ncbi:MAG: bifunctional serine/threonine-protein kinase/formylglycine-generating enzyme family protein, partial [Anaerolineales bacterium]
MSTNLVGQTILGQFQVNAYVASGGMGVVYRVQDLKRSVPLAMKVLHVDLADDPSILNRFEREARALTKLTHPHIVPFYGLYKTRDFAFLVEHFVDGPSLKQYLRQQEKAALPIMEVLTYLKALSAALGYAHAHGVVHCDMKPGNVMIDKGGNVYLTDFGIARHAESTQTTLGMAGTPAYMSPEQIQSEPVSPATDVYALGVMLFELHTGRRPFRGKDSSSSHSGSTVAERIRVEHLTQPPPDPRRFNPDISEPLVQVILKALEKDPRERYHSTQEMFAAACEAAGVRLEDVPDRLPSSQGYEDAPLISAVAEPKRQVFPGFEGRNKFVILGGIGLVFLIGILIITRPFTTDVSTSLLTQVLSPIAMEMSDSRGLDSNSTTTPTPLPDPALIHTAAAQTVQAELTQTARFVPPTETSTPTPTPSPEPSPGLGTTLISPKDDMTIVFIPAGEFIRGLTQDHIETFLSLCSECERQQFQDAEPSHLAYLDAFWIYETEVTNEMYQKCVDAGLCRQPAETSSQTRQNYFGNPAYAAYPVVHVDWFLANQYCQW